MMKKLLIILICLLPSIGLCWTADETILGPGDGANGGDPPSDDLSSTGQDATETWKIFRWQAGGSGDAYIFAVRMVSGSRVADCAYAIWEDNAGSVGDLKVWGYTENYSFTSPGRHYFDMDYVASGKNRAISAGTVYWIGFRSELDNDNTAYYERQGSNTLPSFIDKKGSTDHGSDFSETPPSTFGIDYDNNYYGWTVWTASDVGAEVPSNAIQGITVQGITMK